MIIVKKINKEEFYINPMLIETIEVTPDSIITLFNGKKYLVADTAEDILNSIMEFYKKVGWISPQVIFNSYDFNENKRLK